jgi:glycosyltransferase involved in cell wall biosynthesis
MPHLLYIAYGFPPAVKSGAYRMRGVANAFAARGWDITALTLADAAWDRESGIDSSLLDGLDKRVRRVSLGRTREDLEPDVRLYPWRRARFPDRWRREFLTRSRKDFPETIFGSWRRTYEDAALQIHEDKPADLVLVSPAPNVQLAAALALHEQHGVPYAIDFRDGWSLDVVGGTEAFSGDSQAGKWEARAVDGAVQVWFVNPPIRHFYAERYPGIADRMRVVRNGFDPDLVGHRKPRTASTPSLRFGYVGTVSFKGPQLTAMLDAWKQFRATDPALRNATLEFRGHIGAGFAKGANQISSMLSAAAEDGVSFGGPVNRTTLAALYAEWDALLLALIGGRYVTSGKVYEFMATGLPIVSAHAADHAAGDVLEGYPLWCRPRSSTGLEVDGLAESFAEAARLARAGDDPGIRAAAAAHAAQFERMRVLTPPVAELAALVENGQVVA